MLTISIMNDPVVVAPELRIMARDKLQAGKASLAKLFDQISVAEIALNIPVRRDRPEVHDTHMPTRVCGCRENERSRSHDFLSDAQIAWNE